MEEVVNSSIAEIDKIADEEWQKIPISLLDRPENKITKLLNNDDLNLYQNAQARNYTLYFKEPIFIQTVFIAVEGYSQRDKLEVSYENSKGKTIRLGKKNINDASDTFVISVNTVLNSFSFKPPSKYYTRPKIREIRMYGFDWETIESIRTKIKKIGNEKQKAIEACNSSLEKAQKADEEIKDKNKRISELNNERQELINIKETLDEENKKIITETTSLQSIEEQRRATINELTSRIEAQEDTISKKKTESNLLNESISQEEGKLKSLKDNINMFPAEYNEFVSQGGKNIKLYTWIISIPILIFVTVVTFLFSGAADLSTQYKKLDEIDLYTMIGSRLPFVIISATVIYSCYKLVKFFFEEIMKINRQRMNLSKISIVAKDISDTSMTGLDFDDEEIYEMRTKLKMDLIKSHLKSDIDKDYEYKLDMSVLDKFKKWKKTPKVHSKVDFKNQTVDIDVTEGPINKSSDDHSE